MSLDGSVVVQYPSGFAATAFVSKSGLSWSLEITNTTPAPLSGTIVTQWRLPETSRARTYIVTFVDQLALQFEPERVVLSDDAPSKRPEHFVSLWFGETTAVALAPGQTVVLKGSAAPTPDVDLDGLVGPADVGAVLAAWGPVAEAASAAADLTVDGVVDLFDLAVVIGALADKPG
jgi:hypothetical protein